jgi:hypothetical protein
MYLPRRPYVGEVPEPRLCQSIGRESREAFPWARELQGSFDCVFRFAFREPEHFAQDDKTYVWVT